MTGIEVVELATGSGPPIICVHGALDQHRSFRRAARRIDGRRVLAYDRRGYGRSLDFPPATDIDRHADDLVKIAGADKPVVVGHSMGGLVALTAAAQFPNAFSAVGAYESPYRWKPWWPSDDDGLFGTTPAATAEIFYRTLMGDSAWERAPAQLQAQLRAQGPALETDLRVGEDGPVFEPGEIVIPVRLAHGSESPDRYRRSAQEMAADLAECRITEIAGAGHGAHLSHPDAFALFITDVAAAAS